MLNPVGSHNPAPAAAGLSNNNKRKESEKSELEIIQQYFVKHKPDHQWWGSYANRLITLLQITSDKDPEYAKINSLVEKFFEAQNAPVPAAAAPTPAPEPAARGNSKKGRVENWVEKNYKSKILRPQIISINENLNNNEANPKERQERKAIGMCQLADLFDKYPENKEIAALYQHHFADVVVQEENSPASIQTIAKPVRTPLAQQLSDEYDALRKTHLGIEIIANDKFEALSQLQGLPVDKNSSKISRLDDRYLAFSTSIDKIIGLLEVKPLDALTIMMELSKETQSPTLEDVRQQIISAIANSSVEITKEWLRTLLQECSYGSGAAPLDATPAQIRQLIKNEKIRHTTLIERLNKALNSAPDVSLLLHLSSPGFNTEKR